MIGWRVGWIVAPETFVPDLVAVSLANVVGPVGIAQDATSRGLMYWRRAPLQEGAVAALEVDGPRVARLVGRRHAAGEVLVGALVHRGAALRRRVQALGLALSQLGDALTIDGDGFSDGHGQLMVGVAAAPVWEPLTRRPAGSYNGSAAVRPGIQRPNTSIATAVPGSA